MSKKQVIRLTESDLNNIIKESVQQILMENPENELFGGLSRMFGKIGGDAKKGVENGYNSGRNAVGRFNNAVQDKYNQVSNAVQNKYNQVSNAVQDKYNQASNAVRGYANDLKDAYQQGSNIQDAQRAIKVINDLVNKGVINKSAAKMVIGSMNKYIQQYQ